ncbi:MAG: radical SAM protein [Phycisphaerae bacterium]|nr:radical SAM protein [Phycisphaerae bacterium]
MKDSPDFDSKIVTDHRRQWRDCRYVYPVISRRARGVSIGVNLNLDKRCNFACVYCQINRRLRRELFDVEIPQLAHELDLAIAVALSGELWNEDRFAATPPELRRINDIAFSGDGEPTSLPLFDEAVSAAAEALKRHGLIKRGVKIVIITNATNLQSPQVQRAFDVLDTSNGEFWMKLDAGSQEFFKRINRPSGGMTLDYICENILSVARQREVVIQTLFSRIDGNPPAPAEIDAYCDRISQLLAGGAKIKLVQLHTVARAPSESFVATIPNDQLDSIAAAIREKISTVPLEIYYGCDTPPQQK